MQLSNRLVAVIAAALLAGAAAPAFAQAAQVHYLARPQTVGGNPGQAHNYVCQNADGGPALDCFLDAVRHLYTMCKHVKSIEIIEFGLDKSEEGTNTSKSEYCVDKQKANIAKPYQAALKEATVSKQAVENLRGLYDYWLASLSALKWRPGESDEDYGVRTGMVYPSLDEQIDQIRSIVSEVRETLAAAKTRARR